MSKGESGWDARHGIPDRHPTTRPRYRDNGWRWTCIQWSPAALACRVRHVAAGDFETNRSTALHAVRATRNLANMVTAQTSGARHRTSASPLLPSWTHRSPPTCTFHADIPPSSLNTVISVKPGSRDSVTCDDFTYPPRHVSPEELVIGHPADPSGFSPGYPAR